MTTHSLASTSALAPLPGTEGHQGDQEVVSFPYGLPGFEECRSFVVFTSDAAPFQWLSAVEGPAAAFLTIDPRVVLPTFRCALSAADLSRLQATADTALLWLTTVTVEPDGTIAANLRAPIVINPESMLGQQVMPHDALYPLRHVIYSPEA